jgi:hypothetical protein
MRVTYFEPHHFYEVEGREETPTQEHEWAVRLQYERSFYPGGRSAITVYQGEKPIACMGVVVGFRNGEVWIRMADSPPIFIYRIVRKELARVIEEANLQRLETAIDITKSLNHKFVQRFGFKAYHIAKKFGPNGETFVRYEWVKED